jgi:hypothetical protein
MPSFICHTRECPRAIQVCFDLIEVHNTTTDTLCSLWTREDDSWCYEMQRLLFRTQRRLSNYQYHPQGSCFGDWPIVNPDTSALAHITSVHLRIKAKQDTSRAVSMITSIPSIVDLAVYCEHQYVSGSVIDQTDAALVFGTSAATRRLAHLKNLLLKELDLERVGPVLARAVDFEQVDRLQLIRCCDIHRLLIPLGSLQTTFQTLRIEDCLISCDLAREVEGEGDAFLQAILPTKGLFIASFNDTYSGWRQDWTALLPHAASLHSLRLAINDPLKTPAGPCNLVIPQFSTFCEAASNLQRLAVNTPKIEEDAWAREQGFLAWLVSICALILASLPQPLTVLRTV